MIDVGVLTKVLRKLRYPPTRQINGSSSGSSWFEHDHEKYAAAIAFEYETLAVAAALRETQGEPEREGRPAQKWETLDDLTDAGAELNRG